MIAGCIFKMNNILELLRKLFVIAFYSYLFVVIFLFVLIMLLGTISLFYNPLIIDILGFGVKVVDLK